MFANGVNLDTYAYNVATRTGRTRTAPRRGKNIEISQRHGAIPTPGKKYGANTVILPMWVIGADEDGNVPRDGTMRALFQHNLDMLLGIFAANEVELVDVMPDGSVRRIVGEVLDVIDPDIQAGGTRAQFSVSVQAFTAFWEDTETVTATKTGTGLWHVTALQGATAPMDDQLVRFDGPCTNPRLTNIDGIYVAYNAVLSGTQWVAINCADWSITTGGGLAVSYIPGTGLDHAGDARWFVLTPQPRDPIPRCTFSQTAGTTGKATLTGRRKWLIG